MRVSRTTGRALAVVVFTGAVALPAAVPAAATAGAPEPALLADLNHDGHVTAADARATGEEAIFLPNLDDSQRRCRVDPADLDALGAEADTRLAACNDAADAVVNGEDDAADLARLRLRAMPGVGDGATGELSVDAAGADKIRVFARRDGGGFRPVLPEGGGRITAADLRQGLELGVEGRDVVRDASRWDGRVTITLTVKDGARRSVAEVRMREAPLLLQNDLQPAVEVLAGKPGRGPGTPPSVEVPEPRDWGSFSKTLRKATRQSGLPEPRFISGTSQWWRDIWWQDIFEPTTASMPAPGGTRTMRILVRSGNVFTAPGQDGQLHPTPRPFARLIFRDLRGPGVGVVQQFTVSQRDVLTDMRNATGNVESLPPYDSHPQGRLVYGTGQVRQPDPAFVRLLTGMGQGLQQPVVLDTDWLLVGHVDETMHVVRARNQRGWTLMVADPRLAVNLLREAKAAGDGKAQLFTGTGSAEQPTVDAVLANSRLIADNDKAAGHIDEQIAVMLAETKLPASELVRVPVLFTRADPDGQLLRAYTSGVPNGLSMNAQEFAAPDPHGPVIRGRDIFRQATETALAAQDVRVRWVEDYSWAHVIGGEVHCATNALRDTRSATPWWAGDGRRP
ncbi:protein-arginine deiminase family protein [Nonomuraea pusilla]|uniref:protein-arginine deiminase family protein n=1 Tax=Nonomuraea pusilla TaxID=46177 RepID=UPI00331DEDB2